MTILIAWCHRFPGIPAYSFGDADRARLLARSEQSVENLQRLQAQMVQTEKLYRSASWQRARRMRSTTFGGDSRILGLLADDPTLPEKARVTAGKIRDQARRTKTLVANLLRFARQVPRSGLC